jgi:hypothetical protein
MEKKNGLTKFLAIAGTVLVWFPLLAPVVFAILSLIADGRFRFDYLMPAELGLSFLAGAILLFWAAFRARARVKWIIWSLGIGLLFLLLTPWLSVLTGISSGEQPASGWRMAVFMAAYIAYILALLSTGMGGLLLLRDLFRPVRTPGAEN